MPGLALLVAIATCAVTGVILYICYSPVPWGDMWDFWTWSQKYGTHFLAHIAAQHNEHRIAVARLFFLFDQYYFGGTAKSLAIFIPVIQLLHALLLWRLASRVPHLPRRVTWFLGSIALATAFASQQFTNFTWYFQIQFVGVYFGATFSCLSLLRAAASLQPGAHRLSSRAGLWLAVAIAGGVGTTYCMANGLLIWLILLSLAFFLQLPRGAKMTLLVSGIASWIAYLWGYRQPPQHPSPLMALTHLGLFFRYLITIVGSPFADVIAVLAPAATPAVVQGVAGLIGLAGLIWASLLAMRIVRNRGPAANVAMVYLHLLTFAAFSMILIASGRFTFPLAEALTSRYTTPALLFWLFCVSLTIIRSETSTESLPTRPVVLQGATIALFVLFLVCNKLGRLSNARGYRDYLGGAQVALRSRVFDGAMWARAGYWDARQLIPLTDYLYRHHLSVYVDSWQPALGVPLASRYRVTSPAECTGYVDSVRPLPASDLPGLRIGGWVYDTRLHQSLEHLLLADQTGRIVGSAFGGSPRLDVIATRHDISNPNVGWTGYASGLAHSTITAYMLLPDGRSVCPAGSHLGVTFDTVPWSALGAPLTAVAVDIKGSWALNGYHPSLAPLPVPDRVYASWNGSDANSGTVLMHGIRLAGGSRFAIPIATGPDQNGLSIRVVDGDTQQVLGALAPIPDNPQWAPWLISLPSSRLVWNLNVIAEDAGTGWGEWFAVGLPMTVR